MDVLILTVFASVVLGFGSVLFFAWNVRHRSHEYNEHLALLPLAGEERQDIGSKKEPQ
jgi:hypothetical protein